MVKSSFPVDILAFTIEILPSYLIFFLWWFLVWICILRLYKVTFLDGNRNRSVSHCIERSIYKLVNVLNGIVIFYPKVIHTILVKMRFSHKVIDEDWPAQAFWPNWEVVCNPVIGASWREFVLLDGILDLKCMTVLQRNTHLSHGEFRWEFVNNEFEAIQYFFGRFLVNVVAKML